MKTYPDVKTDKVLKNYIFLTLVVSLSLYCATGVQAQDGLPRMVTAVQVEGNKNVSGATILSKVRTRQGEAFSQVIASDDLKRLYALGYFTDIKIEIEDYAEGVLVIFRVTEKPILSEIALSGNRSIRTDKLKELIKSQTGEFFNIQQLKQDMRDIQKAYEAKGFPLADIDYQMQADEKTNKAKVTIVIVEKARIKITDIFIEGNVSFSDKKLLGLMRTRRDGLFTSGIYRKEVLDLDLERVSSFYQQHGFLDVAVSSEQFFGPEEKMFITIKIEEGREYFVGAIEIQGALIFPEQQLRDRLKMRPGDVFNKDKLRYDLSSLQSFYFEKGYISAEVNVDTILNEEMGKIDLAYKIVENELAYINKIKIRGNTKTKDIVIRRELRSYPGEVFDGEKLRRGKERLYNLGFFQEISYDTEPTEIVNKRDLVVSVKEAKTGEFAFGAGFSSVERFIGFVEVAQRNFDISNWHTFTGAGQDLRLKAEFGSNRREYDLSFTEPWIFGYPLSFGIDGYNKVWERSGSTGYSYDEERSGGDLRLGKELSELVRADLMYKFENVDISNVPDNASAALRQEVGENTISSLFLKVARDSRDNIYNPKTGTNLSCSGEVAGGPLGQDKDFFRLVGILDSYKTFLEKLLLEFKVVVGASGTYSDTDSLPIYERFFTGGTNTVRGFEERSIGPKDSSGEPLGGESTLYGTCELTYPFLQFFKVAAFYDFGNVWEKLSEMGSGSMKYSVGMGLRVKTPIGPVKLDYGYPLKVDLGEEKEGRFHFSMSRGF